MGEHCGPGTGDLLAPYASELARAWLEQEPGLRLRELPGTLVFADISGFTRLTERLAKKGRYGAEEMSDILDVVLSGLLDAAYARGGWLVKWGGDALLLMFEGAGDVERGCAAAADMHAVMRDLGKLQTSVGRVRLRMSVGVHRGVVDFVFVGVHHRELLVTGDAASITASMEATAEAGEVVLSPEAAAALPPECVGVPKGDGVLLAGAPRVGLDAVGSPHRGLGSAALLPGPVVAHLTAGGGSGEHRLVAVAFVEFRGVGALRATRGAGAVVDAVERLVSVTQAACHQFGVTFHETDIGPDGGKIMLVAGAPTALDNHAEAMLCTVRAVVDDETPLAVRAGVTTGRVFTGAVGPAYRRSYSVKGDVVNMAARVMGKSRPGEVWAVEAVVPHSRTQFELTALPPFMVKGKTAPITAYAVGRSLGRADDSEAELPLVGRVAALAAFELALASARGGQGAVLDVVAAAGMGKTRLLAECRHAAGDARVVSTSAEPMRSASPYSAVRPIVHAALGLGRGAPATLASRLAAWCAATAPHLDPWLPLLGTVLGVPVAETAATRDLDEQFRKERLELTVLDALRAAMPQPTVLLVDDAQYADDGSLELLARCAEVVTEQPWVLIVSRRDTDATPAAVTAAVPVHLDALDDGAARALVEAETEAAPLPPHVTAAVIVRGAGNPLFLRELARTARDVSSAEELPDSVHNLVTTQIDRLAPRDRDVLRAASVIGVSVDPELLGALLGGDSDDAPAPDTTPLRGLLQADGAVLRFRQALVAEAAYEGMPYRRRTSLHGRLADLLARDEGADDAVLSFHCFQAGRYADAAAYAERAAERAAATYANVEAAALYQRALNAAGRAGADRVTLATLHESLGDMRGRLGEFTLADASYAAARRLRRGDVTATGRIALKAARHAELFGNWTLALGRLKRIEGLVADGNAPEHVDIRVRALLRRGFVRFQQGRLREARAACVRVLSDTDGDAYPSVVADALRVLDAIDVGLGVESPPGSAERALALYERVGDLSGQARMLNSMGYRAHFAGRWAEALALYQRSRDLFDRVGDTWNAAIEDGNIAEIYSNQGRLRAAEPLLRSALRVWRAADARDYSAFGECLLGRLLTRQGHHEEGWALLEQSARTFRELGALSSVIEADGYAAEALLLQGRPAEALHRATTALEQARAQSASPAAAPHLLRVVGAARDALGDPAAAADAYAEALDLARRRGAAHEVAFTLGALIGRAGHDGTTDAPGVSPEWLAEAGQLHASLGLVLDLTAPQPQPAPSDEPHVVPA